MLDVNVKNSRLATKMIFLVCGLSISGWAPMVPYVKDKLQLNDADLGLLLLFLGAGSICTMPLSGWFIHRIGTRKVIAMAAILIAVSFPVLLMMHSWATMAAVLFLFGAGVGSIDVAMNAHGVHLQNLSDKNIMSSLHGLFSVGGLSGPIIIGLLMKLGLTPVVSAMIISLLLLIIVGSQFKHLMNFETEQEVNAQFSGNASSSGGGKSWFTSAVIFLGVLCFISFLSEGAMLDWSAVFLRDNKGVQEAMAGIGYASFSVAMAGMRLFGDRIVNKVPAKMIVLLGAITGFAGFLLAIFSPWLPLVLAGFVIVGIGAANMVPVFFSAAGRLKNVNSTTAVSAISTMGYAGQLAGPAMLGFIAHHYSLPVALLVTAALLLLVGISYTFAATGKSKTK